MIWLLCGQRGTDREYGARSNGMRCVVLTQRMVLPGRNCTALPHLQPLSGSPRYLPTRELCTERTRAMGGTGRA
eukprot:2453186-Rhodomonas_salina.9